LTVLARMSTPALSDCRASVLNSRTLDMGKLLGVLT
jgi:hypothetical protein